jgi:uncharacterized protein (TIGR02145 family)
MNKRIIITAALALAITLTLIACEEKKKPDSSEAADTPVPTAKADYGSLTDSRDGKVYKTVKIGYYTWMAENLNYKTPSGNSRCYDNNEANCGKYGRLYDWDAAMNACPAGWHLPSNEEWKILIAAGGSISGTRLKAGSGWKDKGNGTDDLGFSALPGGFGYSDGYFNSVGISGYWWTATDNSSDNAYYWGMSHDLEYALYTGDGKTSLYSVRCLKGEAVATNTPAPAAAEGEKSVHTVTFKDKEIPITVFHSPKSDSDCILDGLAFQYDGVKQTVRFQGTEKQGNSNYKFDCNNGILLNASDYNFDGYMDIDIISEGNDSENKCHSIFLYSPQTKNFTNHKGLSKCDVAESGIETDDEEKTVKFVSLGRFYALGNYDIQDSHISKHKWEKGKLVEIHNEMRVYDEALGKSILTTKTLQSGEWVQKIDTISIGGE